MISLPDGFVQEVDRRARAEHRSRSELIREALRAHLAPRGRRDAWRASLAPLRALEHLWVGQWDSTDVIRYYRDRRRGRQDRR